MRPNFGKRKMEENENNINVSTISEKLGISDERTLFFISKLIRDKKVQVTGLKEN